MNSLDQTVAKSRDRKISGGEAWAALILPIFLSGKKSGRFEKVGRTSQSRLFPYSPDFFVGPFRVGSGRAVLY